jgi:RNA polymerase sigma factor (TIGR02999 family)
MVGLRQPAVGLILTASLQPTWGGMEDQKAADVTELLAEWAGGNPDALERLVPLVYRELRAIAARQLRRERGDHTLQPTALVHEAYLKLLDQRPSSWKNRGHFFAVAAQAMRRILVDHARAHRAVKRGRDIEKVAIEIADGVVAAPTTDMLALDEALTRLSALDPRQGQVVELRCFGGLTIEETADAVGLSLTTVKEEWRLAKAWLHRELRGDTQAGGSRRDGA